MSNQREIIMEIENHLKETMPLVCQACGGTGKLRVKQLAFIGPWSFSVRVHDTFVTCGFCNGRGWVPFSRV